MVGDQWVVASLSKFDLRLVDSEGQEAEEISSCKCDQRVKH